MARGRVVARLTLSIEPNEFEKYDTFASPPPAPKTSAPKVTVRSEILSFPLFVSPLSPCRVSAHSSALTNWRESESPMKPKWRRRAWRAPTSSYHCGALAYACAGRLHALRTSCTATTTTTTTTRW